MASSFHFASRLLVLSLLAAAVAFWAGPAHAQNGTWTLDGTGNWSDIVNWSSGAGPIADGSGNTADFSTIDITADGTVHLDSARTIGNLTFGDTDPTTTPAGWILDNNATPANILTLAGTTPTITVNALGSLDAYVPKSVNISAVIAGADGLTKAGAGMLRLSGANTYSGGTAISGGTLWITNDNQLGAVPGSADPANITITNGGAILLGDSVTNAALAANRGITVGAGVQNIVKWSRRTATINGVIRGSGAVNFGDNTPATFDGGGGGRFQINAANTYTGDTTITFLGIKDPGIFLNNSLALQNSTLDYRKANTPNAQTTDLLWFNGGQGSYTFGGLKGDKNLNLSPQGNTAHNLKIGNNDQTTTYTGIIRSSNDASAGITKIGTGTLTLSGNNSYTGLTTVQAGTLQLVGTTAAPKAWAPVLTGAGSDIQGGKMTFDYTTDGITPAATIQGLLTTSYAGGAWNTGQFKNTTADASRGLGWADNGVDQVKVAYTFYGDATLDGSVDATDLAKVLANYNQLAGMVWSQGDFDYNAAVDASDLAKVLANYNQGPIVPGITAVGAAGSTVVPEPGTLVLLAAGLVTLLAYAYAWRKRN